MSISRPDQQTQTDLASCLVCGMSRSGTTLLVTMLDSHKEISMGYEMLPAGIDDLGGAASNIELCLEELGQHAVAKDVQAWLKKQNMDSVGKFVRQADRAAVSPKKLPSIIRSVEATVDTSDKLAVRYALSVASVECKRKEENTSISGFKLNAPSIAAFDKFSTGENRYIFVLRDPRDIYASHKANDFDRDVEHVCGAWNQYLQKFLAFAANHPERTMLVRYEDVVRRIDEHVVSIGKFLDLEDPSPMRNFFDSKASVHQAGHTNSESLGQDIFDKSIGRWSSDLSKAEVNKIESLCSPLMRANGYVPVNADNLVKISSFTQAKKACELIAKRALLARKKVYYRNNYESLVLPWVNGRTNLTWAEAATGKHSPTEEVLVLRHDVDHDFETALKMGAWEHEQGLRATYCILHTAWYYGKFSQDGKITRHAEMLDCCKELQSMGHEINLHNNFIVESLRTGFNPLDMMRCELAFMRWNGINITGSSTHGDGLCRDLEFRNYEIFSESVYPARGGPRTIEKDGHKVDIGYTSMETLQLDYEAYDLPRDHYITDSGGNLRVRKNTRGRAGLRRKDLPNPPKYKKVVGILTHPVWWTFDADAPPNCKYVTNLPEEIEPPV